MIGELSFFDVLEMVEVLELHGVHALVVALGRPEHLGLDTEFVGVISHDLLLG